MKMRNQKVSIVHKMKHYHDIFKCLRDEICGEGNKRSASKVVTITETDGHYSRCSTTEEDTYFDLDDLKKGRYEYDRQYSEHIL